jgi:hypothetical protein
MVRAPVRTLACGDLTWRRLLCRAPTRQGEAPGGVVRESRLAPRAQAVVLFASAVLLVAGCGTANTPETAAGVRAMYRSIGIDASAANYSDICHSYMDEQLRGELEPLNKKCFTSTFEHWAEKVWLSKIKSQTRIVVAGDEATVYDGAKPERALYIDGQWRLAEVPEITASQRARPGTSRVS